MKTIHYILICCFLGLVGCSKDDSGVCHCEEIMIISATGDTSGVVLPSIDTPVSEESECHESYERFEAGHVGPDLTYYGTCTFQKNS